MGFTCQHRYWRVVCAGLAIAALVAWSGCGSEDPGDSGSGGSGGSGGAGGAGGGAASVDLPCDILKILEGKCLTCHGEKPVPGAPMSLASRADFLAKAKSDPSESVGEKCLERMESQTSPMPPGGGATAPDIAAMKAWLADGMPQGTCDNPQ